MSVRRALLWACRVGLWAWLLVVLVALHAPTPSAVPEAGALYAEVGGRLPDAPDILGDLIGDKTLHGLLFAPLGALWLGCRRLGRRSGGVVAVGLLVLSVSSEALQRLGGRVADPADVAADLAGGLLGAGAVQAVASARRRWRQGSGGGEAAPLEEVRAEQQP